MPASVQAPDPGAASAAFELRFQSLFSDGRALTFPCDGGGQVSLDALSERARLNDLSAPTVVGRKFAVPVVRPRTASPGG